MQENYSSTKLPTTASTSIGGKFNSSPWLNPTRITADDGSLATWGAFEAAQGASISGGGFGFPALPAAAVIDGIQVTIEGMVAGGVYGNVSISPAGSVGKPIGALNGNYGGATDKWGLSVINPADIATFSVGVDTNDVSGGDAYAQIDHITVTVFWHVAPINTAPADVPTRLAYKMYSRAGKYLGELENPVSRLLLAQEMNSAGTALDISVAKDLRNVTEVEPLLTEDGLDILTEDDHTIYAEFTELLITTGNSEDEAIFKNSNRVKVWLYNYWYPNGKLMFSGQINRISFSYGAASGYVNLRAFSDGYDLANYVARGYPFNYTADVQQLAASVTKTVMVQGGKGSGWDVRGQSWRTGAAVSNFAALKLMLNGTATVTIVIYDAVNGNKIGEMTKAVATVGTQEVLFEMPQLLDVAPNTVMAFGIWLPEGQSIIVSASDVEQYANGSMLRSLYAGGSGGGAWSVEPGDLYFATYSGVPTTSATYANQDPVTGMMDKVLADYNNRGGFVKKRNFQAAGYNLTYTFNLAYVLDIMKKSIDLSPRGFYSYIDLGTAEMDILQASSTPDFTVVRGRDIEKLDVALTIEQVKNYLLFSGGETAGVNLYRDYQDIGSAANYGLRTIPQSDNRVTQAATADALGNAFIDENSEEVHETQITVSNKHIDITKLTPGKTIGFKNFGNFIDLLVLQIVRREYNPDSVTLTLGRLPVTLSAEVQRITRELLNEQTAKNPASPS